MNTVIRSVEAFAIAIPRDTPYLGPLEPGVQVTGKGYFVRPGNHSVYSVRDQSVLVRITTGDGTVGWGECVGFVAPQAPQVLVREILGPFLIGRDVEEAPALYREMYDLMRVRGFFGGYFHDAIAAVDIALWDARARAHGLPLGSLLGGDPTRPITAYVSGLPCATLAERVKLACSWRDKGFPAVKFATAVAHGGPIEEMRQLRAALGPAMDILCDMHWKFTASEAIALIDGMNAHRLTLAEAPCVPEDVDGQARVAAAVRCPVALGEELRTVYEYLPRFERRCMGIIQPEMGRTGITAFMEIATLARAFHVRIMPHASIGIGIFQAASLHASCAVPGLVMHEYQHSIFDKNLACLNGDMRCAAGAYRLPTGAGLGVEPAASWERFIIQD
jgi:L-alanine-DL-glutamate epimerase-like enolase superfamily enzyme